MMCLLVTSVTNMLIFAYMDNLMLLFEKNLYARELRTLLKEINDMYHESIIVKASGKDNSDRYMKKSLLPV